MDDTSLQTGKNNRAPGRGQPITTPPQNSTQSNQTTRQTGSAFDLWAKNPSGPHLAQNPPTPPRKNQPVPASGYFSSLETNPKSTREGLSEADYQAILDELDDTKEEIHEMRKLFEVFVSNNKKTPSQTPEKTFSSTPEKPLSKSSEHSSAPISQKPEALQKSTQPKEVAGAKNSPASGPPKNPVEGATETLKKETPPARITALSKEELKALSKNILEAVKSMDPKEGKQTAENLRAWVKVTDEPKDQKQKYFQNILIFLQKYDPELTKQLQEYIAGNDANWVEKKIVHDLLHDAFEVAFPQKRSLPSAEIAKTNIDDDQIPNPETKKQDPVITSPRSPENPLTPNNPPERSINNSITQPNASTQAANTPDAELSPQSIPVGSNSNETEKKADPAWDNLLLGADEDAGALSPGAPTATLLDSGQNSGQKTQFEVSTAPAPEASLSSTSPNISEVPPNLTGIDPDVQTSSPNQAPFPQTASGGGNVQESNPNSFGSIAQFGLPKSSAPEAQNTPNNSPGLNSSPQKNTATAPISPTPVLQEIPQNQSTSPAPSTGASSTSSQDFVTPGWASVGEEKEVRGQASPVTSTSSLPLNESIPQQGQSAANEVGDSQAPATQTNTPSFVDDNINKPDILPAQGAIFQ